MDEPFIAKFFVRYRGSLLLLLLCSALYLFCSTACRDHSPHDFWPVPGFAIIDENSNVIISGTEVLGVMRVHYENTGTDVMWFRTTEPAGERIFRLSEGTEKSKFRVSLANHPIISITPEIGFTGPPGFTLPDLELSDGRRLSSVILLGPR